MYWNENLHFEMFKYRRGILLMNRLTKNEININIFLSMISTYLREHHSSTTDCERYANTYFILIVR